MTLDELRKFGAGPEETPAAMRQPWTRGGYTWASDGCIIVRVPTIDSIPDNANAPDATRLFSAKRAKKWMPVPAMAMPPDIPCKWCDGTGKESWDRRYKCEYCGGAKMLPDRSGIPLGGTAFAKRYLAVIQGWEIAPNGQKAAWIRHDDALGLLMPMRM